MKNFTDIEAFAAEYFDCLHEGDIRRTRAMYIDSCQLQCVNDDGTVNVMSMENYLAAVASRIAPKAAGHDVSERCLASTLPAPIWLC